MNQEEFDNRLGESFKNEYLPPDKRLWENISSRLDDKKKKPFWFWLIPVLVAFVAAGAWAINGLISDSKTTAAETTILSTPPIGKTVTVNTEQDTEISEMANSSNNAGDSDTPSKVISTSSFESLADNSHATTPANNTNHNSSTNNNSTSNNNNSSTNNNSNSLPNSHINNNGSSPEKSGAAQTGTSNTTDNTSENSTLPPSAIVPELPILAETILLKSKSLRYPVKSLFTMPQENALVENNLFKNGKILKSAYTRNPVDFDQNWFWSFGMGPQVSMNKAIIDSNSHPYVHKALWAIRDKMTHNGSGFQSQLMLGRKVGNFFTIETGLQFSSRAEDIRFNTVSPSVETRDSHNKITNYEDSLKIAIVINGDTTYYNATRGFSLAVKNRYQVFTIPVKFNTQFNITKNTSFYAGAGFGFSAITTSTATHLNLTNDQEIIEKKKHMFTASLNAQFGFYTNFNDIGQLGIYSGIQLYSKPWELTNKEYAIRMSDLQFGISFRRPLNWGR